MEAASTYRAVQAVSPGRLEQTEKALPAPGPGKVRIRLVETSIGSGPEENTLMPNDMHETAPTQLFQVGDVRFAFRRFGRRGGLPLLFLNYFVANMDDWDPKVTNGFAAEHDVILFDKAGVGSSSSGTPSTATRRCSGSCDVRVEAAEYRTAFDRERRFEMEVFNTHPEIKITTILSAG